MLDSNGIVKKVTLFSGFVDTRLLGKSVKTYVIASLANVIRFRCYIPDGVFKAFF